MPRTLEEIQDELLDQVHAGAPLDQAAILEAYPEHADDLVAFFALLDVVEGGDPEGVPPSSLGEYRILREIGRGGMGVVYEAEQTSLKRHVALKVLPATLRMDTRLARRFQREAEAAGRLSHPGIVPVFAVGEAGGTPFFAMEYVPGRTLREIIRLRKEGEDAGLPTDEAAWRRWCVETCAKVAEALAYAHGEGILHRDVKPGNILINGDGQPRLTDFGLARDLRTPGLSLTGEVLGSPQYMSPEQAIRHDHPVDERTDIYSLAVTCYQLLTLKLPYPAATHAELFTALASGQIVAPRQHDPGMPKALEQVLLCALRKDPHERYQDAASFAEDLRASLDGRAPSHVAVTPRRSKAGWIAALLVAGLALWWIASDVGEHDDHPQASAPEPDDAAPAQDAIRTAVNEIIGGYELHGPQPGEPIDPALTRASFRAHLTPLEALAMRRDATEEERALIAKARGRILRDYIRGPGRDDEEARAFLGHTKFDHDVPDAITHRNHAFLRAVAWAAEKRWFTADEQDELRLAREAWEETQKHLERLVHDPTFAQGERAAAALGQDSRLAAHTLTTRWQEPYLICHVSDGPTSRFDALGGKKQEMAAHEAGEKRVEASLDRLSRLYAQFYAAYMRRYQQGLGLKPLMDAWGGRPDMPENVRSYRHGVPLVVVQFDTRTLFDAFTERWRGGLRPQQVAGVMDPRTGFVYLNAPPEGETVSAWDIAKAVYDGTQQLEYWFARQRRNWRMPKPSQDWFVQGLPEYWAGVSLDDEGDLHVTGWNAARLGSMKQLRSALKMQGKTYPVFPIGRLVGFASFPEVMKWGAEQWQLNPSIVLSLFLQQSWALVRFLEHGQDTAYRTRFDDFHQLHLSGERGVQPFLKAFGLRSEDDFAPLDKAFQDYVKNTLMTMELTGAGR